MCLLKPENCISKSKLVGCLSCLDVFSIYMVCSIRCDWKPEKLHFQIQTSVSFVLSTVNCQYPTFSEVCWIRIFYKVYLKKNKQNICAVSFILKNSKCNSKNVSVVNCQYQNLIQMFDSLKSADFTFLALMSTSASVHKSGKLISRDVFLTVFLLLFPYSDISHGWVCLVIASSLLDFLVTISYFPIWIVSQIFSHLECITIKHSWPGHASGNVYSSRDLSDGDDGLVISWIIKSLFSIVSSSP